MQPIAVSSRELAPGLDDRVRFSLWQDLYTAQFGRLDLSRAEERPFSAQFEFEQFGPVAIGRFAGTITRVARTAQHIASDSRQDFCLVVNRGRSSVSALHRSRVTRLAPNAAILLSDSEVAEIQGKTESPVLFLNMPRARLLELVADIDDLAGVALDPTAPVLRHLKRYLDIVLEGQAIRDDPELREHVGLNLVDLAVLALGPGLQQEQIARLRGLRAARLQEILAEIKIGFARPGFSPLSIALKLGLSPRYIQDLLHDVGTSFTERVTEYRLQKARGLLCDPKQDRARVAEIAYACGFNDLSHFNRCFRHRFGASPTQFRGKDVSS
jgi:AraC-like DNA-binding protein